MPSLNLTSKQLRYTAADLAALDKAATLLAVMAGHDEAAKLDATTALNALNHVITHVEQQRKH